MLLPIDENGSKDIDAIGSGVGINSMEKATGGLNVTKVTKYVRK